MKTLALILLAFASPIITLQAADWPQFRGPSATSVAPDPVPNAAWQEKPNILWTADLPGRGPSSPIVSGGKVFVTSSWGDPQDRLCVLALDAATGRELWRREFWATGRTLIHPFAAVAAPTPATDGRHVFAFYSSNDLFCLDFEGNLVWFRGLAYDWPKAGNDAGMGSSVLAIGDTVVVQMENQGDSFAAGISTDAGETRWRVDRKRVACWCTPVSITVPGENRPAVLLQSSTELTAHDPRTGAQFWRHEARCSTLSTLAAGGSRIFLPAAGITALEWTAANEPPKVLWQSNRLSVSNCSPLYNSDRLYMINGAGVLNCAEAATGKSLWQLRLAAGQGAFWSTPVIAGDRMYCFREDGTALVVGLGDRGELLGTHAFGEAILASTAAADGALYVRSDRHLWKIGSR
jgi:outer membrane protein assembly factor BamB